MSSRFEPCIVFDLETTGFHPHGRIIEVGAVVITRDARVVSPISFFVWQPEAHLRHPRSQPAQAIHQIPVATILEQGLPAAQAAPRLKTWGGRVQARHKVASLRAYNQSFDFAFLSTYPWCLEKNTGIPFGECILEEATEKIGQGRRVRLSRAVELANEGGAAIEWQADAHRAEEDARIAAEVAIWLATL